jgi:hypothetical protein
MFKDKVTNNIFTHTLQKKHRYDILKVNGDKYYNDSHIYITAGGDNVIPTTPRISSKDGGFDASRIRCLRNNRAIKPHANIRESSSPGHMRLPKNKNHYYYLILKKKSSKKLDELFL